jgi:drug/metabolite transporter (DMT)-like permease
MITIIDQFRNGSARAASRFMAYGHQQISGIALVILSTLAIAIVPSFAKLAYEGGSNTITVITARSILSVALTWLVVISLRQTLRVGWKPILISVATGICYAVMLYGFLGAVAFIPINTAILIYFIHPLLVGLLAVWFGDERVTVKKIAALIAAFSGLGLAVGFSFGSLNLAGVGLATLATITCVFVIMGNGLAVKQAGGLVVVMYMMLSAAVTLAFMFLMFGTFALPVTTTGWLGFAGVAIGSTIGTLAFFCAVPRIGMVRATMISNVEPLLGIIFAVLILGEKISLAQGIGIAMVLASIVAVEVEL